MSKYIKYVYMYIYIYILQGCDIDAPKKTPKPNTNRLGPEIWHPKRLV